LLEEVYVGGGFTELSVAQTLFDPAAVRRRGTLFIAMDLNQQALIGMVILVPPDSEACKLAKQGEAEIHLLAVKDSYRGRGVGKKLIQAAIAHADRAAYRRLILWTQPSMIAAQQLYASCGFRYINDFAFANKTYKLFHKELPLSGTNREAY